MPAILFHASSYPPSEWRLILSRHTLSTDQLWVEMTAAYDLSMDARQLQFSATIKDTITKTNMRLFQPEAFKELEKKASVPKRMGFEQENDIGYTFLNIDRYRVGFEGVVRYRLRRIVEDQVLVLEADSEMAKSDH